MRQPDYSSETLPGNPTTIRRLIKTRNSHLSAYVRSFTRDDVLLALVQRWQQAPNTQGIGLENIVNCTHPIERLWTSTTEYGFGMCGNTLLRIERAPLSPDLLTEVLLWVLLDWNDLLKIEHVGWVWGDALQYSHVLERSAFVRDLDNKRAMVRWILVNSIHQRIHHLLRLKGKTPYMTFEEGFFETLEKYREQPEALLSAPLEDWRLVGHHVT